VTESATELSLSQDDAYLLDHAAWASLTGPHAHLAEVRGQAARYPADVSPFIGVAPDPDERVWADLAALAGPGAFVPLTGVEAAPPDGWEVLEAGEGVQMVDTAVAAQWHPDVVRLGPGDVPDMLALTARTKPGPFLPRTIEMGTYLGLRDQGALVALAGQRLHPPGWVEISAVCTDAAYRGRGLATRLVQSVAADIRDAGSRPFLHAVGTNVNAIRLYQSIGFTLRRRARFSVARIPR